MKPNISLLFHAFQTFMLAQQKAGYNKAEWDKAREQLRKDLALFGIAESFDWTEG